MYCRDTRLAKLMAKIQIGPSLNMYFHSSSLCRTHIGLHCRVLPLSYFSLGSIRGVTRTNMVPVPSFMKRRVATPSASAPISALAPVPPLFSLIDKDDEVPPHDTDLRPCKRKAVDVGG